MNMKRITKWLLGVLLLLVGGYFFSEWQMRKAISEFLERKVPNHVNYSYDRLAISLIHGDLEFESPKVNSIGRQTSSCEIAVNTERISIKGFSYWRFFLKDEIHAKEIRLKNPIINFKTCPKDTINQSQTSTKINLLKPISVNSVVFESGKVQISDSKGEEILLAIESLDFKVKEVGTDSVQIKKYIPVTFGDYNLNFEDVSGPSGGFEEFFIGAYKMDNTSVEISDFELKTKFTKKELSTEIQYERDHILLKMPHIKTENYHFSVLDEVLYLNMDSIGVDKPSFDIYRDKNLLDNQKRRPLYAELLRDLPVKLTINHITIDEGTLTYEEDAPNNTGPGILTFEDLGVQIANFSNEDEDGEEVSIKINSKFMGSGILDLDWRFKVFDPHEAFIISGGLRDLQTTSLNDFLVPNARLRAEGTIDQMYFTMSGGDFTAQGDIKMNYEDFKLQLLNKERNQVKKLISFIGNLFINDGSKVDEDGFRHGTIEISRNQNKSFFNYLWIGLEDGLIDVITGSGKKK